MVRVVSLNTILYEIAPVIVNQYGAKIVHKLILGLAVNL
jgi:hypothetical protein